MIECYRFFCMYLFFGNAIGSTLEGNAGRDWWPGKMRGNAINEQTLLTERDMQRSWNFCELVWTKVWSLSAASIFSAATCCLSRHSLSVFGSPLASSSLRALQRGTPWPSRALCISVPSQDSATAGGGWIKWCKHRGVSSAGGVYWVGHRGQKPPTSFAHMLIETFLLTPPPATTSSTFARECDCPNQQASCRSAGSLWGATHSCSLGW